MIHFNVRLFERFQINAVNINKMTFSNMNVFLMYSNSLTLLLCSDKSSEETIQVIKL